MVTKLKTGSTAVTGSCVLAKIHMVTKPTESDEVGGNELCSSKNPYGNKTSP